MGETIEVQVDEVAIRENPIVTSENEREDDKSMEINGEIDKSLQYLPSNDIGSTPNIHVDKCNDFNRSKYKRRMSKSCDELDVKVKPNTTSNWRSWSDFLSSISNSMTRIKNGLSIASSISHVDQLVDTQNEKQPEENQD